jgi:hypothetical protein
MDTHQASWMRTDPSCSSLVPGHGLLVEVVCGIVNLAEQHAATRLVRLCLHPDGTLPRSPLLASTARAALLADLALHEALTSTADGLGLDTTPTGFIPADNLLAAVAAEPDKSMEWWLRRGTDAVRDIVADLLATGVWTRRLTGVSRRYRDTDPAGVKTDAVGVHDILDGATADRPSTAVLAALVGVVGTDEQPGGQHSTDSELAACGAASWLMSDLIDYLLARRKLLNAAAADARIALSANFIS